MYQFEGFREVLGWLIVAGFAPKVYRPDAIHIGTGSGRGEMQRLLVKVLDNVVNQPPGQQISAGSYFITLVHI